MFKDYDKYLSTSLKVYLFVLVVVFIMKLVGLDYFGLDVNNPIIINIEEFLTKTKLIYVVDFVALYIMFYVCFAIICKNQNVKLLTLISTLIEFDLQLLIIRFNLFNELKLLLDFLIIVIGPVFYYKKLKLKKPILMIIIITIYQLISYLVRGQQILSNYNNAVMDLLLNVDQYIMLIITYKLYFLKGDVKLCYQEVYSSLLNKINLKLLLKRLQENLHKFKNKEKVEKLTIIIYFILSLIWNLFTLLCIVIVAVINNTFVECVFITLAFWSTKTVFGKPFHLTSMFKCFVISNLTYYVLNKVTVPLGISIFIPIMLGVGLSYVTSKFVKKTYKPLYKGMPIDTFEDTILMVTEKDSVKYKICHEFYIDKVTDVALSYKYHYSVAGIQKIKSRINDKIKGLN